MDEHVCEWRIVGLEYGLAEIQCIDSECLGTLPINEGNRRLNATERLNSLKAQLYSEHIVEEPPFLIDECAADLKTYANILEGK